MVDIIRRVIFRPYRKGLGPSFTLVLIDRGFGSYRVAASLTMRSAAGDRETVFSDVPFRPSPLHADDADETVRAVMTFFTLRLGDTDRDYFDDYTETQVAFRDAHAEALAFEVYSRFGE
jgi:hypothetical protein